MSILVVGSVALDTVETPAGKATDVLGGSATYFAFAASLFAGVRVVAPVGEDFPGEHVRLFESRRIDVSHLKRCAGGTFRWHGRYGDDPNERVTVSVCANAFEDFHPRLSAEERASEFVFLANVDPALQQEVLSQVERPALVAMDTMDLWIRTQRDMVISAIGSVDMLLVNDCEAQELSGERNLVRAAGWLRERGPRMVVIKKGEHGAFAVIGERMFLVPGYPLAGVVDPTGAGDAFAGGLIGSIAESGAGGDDELRRGVVYGSIMGSFTVEGFSLERLGVLERSEVDGRYAEFRELLRVA